MMEILGRPNFNTQVNYRLQNDFLSRDPRPHGFSLIEAYLPFSRNKGKIEINQQKRPSNRLWLLINIAVGQQSSTCFNLSSGHLQAVFLQERSVRRPFIMINHSPAQLDARRQRENV